MYYKLYEKRDRKRVGIAFGIDLNRINTWMTYLMASMH
jgi:hypothetical protein